MGRQSKEEKLRYEGISWAFDKIEREGLEAAKKYFESRAALHYVMGVEESEVRRFEYEIKSNCKKTMCAMTCMVLHDEFGFGHDRLEKFIRRWNLKVDCINEDFVDWPDFAEILLEECGIDIDLPLGCANHWAGDKPEGEAKA